LTQAKHRARLWNLSNARGGQQQNRSQNTPSHRFIPRFRFTPLRFWLQRKLLPCFTRSTLPRFTSSLVDVSISFGSFIFLGFHAPVLPPQRQLQPVPQSQLVVNHAKIIFDHMIRCPNFGGDFCVRHARRHQCDNFLFALAQSAASVSVGHTLNRQKAACVNRLPSPDVRITP